jgi:ribonuclease HIII
MLRIKKKIKKKRISSLQKTFPSTDLKQVSVGVDEAGRGPWAGPVVCAAVVSKSIATTNNQLILRMLLDIRIIV